MSACVGDNFGGPLSETQHGMCQISGKYADDRASYAIFFFRRLPSASGSFRHLPPASVLVRGAPCACVGEMSVWLDDDAGRAFLGILQGMGQMSGGKSAYSRAAYAIFTIPSASVGYRHLPPSSVLGLFRPLRPLAKCLHAWVVISRGQFRKPKRPCAKFRENRSILWMFRPFSASARSRRLPPSSALGISSALATCRNDLAAMSWGGVGLFRAPKGKWAEFRTKRSLFYGGLGRFLIPYASF